MPGPLFLWWKKSGHGSGRHGFQPGNAVALEPVQGIGNPRRHHFTGHGRRDPAVAPGRPACRARAPSTRDPRPSRDWAGDTGIPRALQPRPASRRMAPCLLTRHQSMPSSGRQTEARTRRASRAMVIPLARSATKCWLLSDVPVFLGSMRFGHHERPRGRRCRTSTGNDPAFGTAPRHGRARGG